LSALRHPRFWSVAAWTWLAAVVFFSLGPSVIEPGGLPIATLYHALSYLALQWLFGSLYPPPARRLLLAATFIALGIGIELLQGMTTYRLADPWDAAANTVGVVVGLVLLRRFSADILERRWLTLVR